MASPSSCPPNPKIIDIISKKRDDGKPHVSLEYFPPRTEEGVKVRICRHVIESSWLAVSSHGKEAAQPDIMRRCTSPRRRRCRRRRRPLHLAGRPTVPKTLAFSLPCPHHTPKNLYARMDRMKKTLSPAFTDVTWGAGGSTADLSLDLALYLQRTGHVSNMHLTCTNLEGKTDDPKEAVLQALKDSYDGGIRNIVALRGDPPAGQDEWKASEGGFTCALDLVHFIKSRSDAMDFGISVAGYPEGHPNAITEVDDVSKLSETEKARSSHFDGKTYCCLDADYQNELDYLKQKIDAGAGACVFGLENECPGRSLPGSR